jgi:hypothetical protein
MTNVNLVASELAPLGGASNSGVRVGYVVAGAKAAQNDTWTITNASEIVHVIATLDATGGAEINSFATNVITLASATATACSALIIYKV